ncbi:MAG: MFS transporter [Lentisphaeria bacterium]|nr:MFS transporter [Lentisphaeria bacterium]
MMVKESYARRVTPLVLSQFFGVFNDNAFKMFVVLVVFNQLPDYFQGAAFMFALTAAYVLPFILLCGFTGRAADAMPKRSILILSKVAELAIMLFGTFCFIQYPVWGVWPLFGVMFLMTTQSAFFSPAYNGSMPETFPETEISKANGLSGMLTFLAAILGAGTAPGVWLWSGKSFVRCGELLCLFSILGLFASYAVVPYAKRFHRTRSVLQSFRDGWKGLTATRALWVTALGDAFFCSVGVVIQTLIVLYAKFMLHSNELEMCALLLAPAVGIGLGCFLCGLLSGKRVELGFVLPGGIGLALFLFLAGGDPGYAWELTPFVPELVVHVRLLLKLVFAGLCAGFFIVPMRAYFQQWVQPEKRGAALSVDNLLSFASILIFSFLLLLLTAGRAPEDLHVLPAWLESVRLPAFDPANLFKAFAGVTLLGVLIGALLLPELSFRTFMLLLTHTLFKVRVTGTEKIPTNGPMLMVSNHASFVDNLLISSCTSRRIRFLMHEDYYRIPLLYPFARFLGFIEVPRGVKRLKTMIDIVRQALRDGDVVCAFPEGKITRNGLMDEFSGGYSIMLPEDRKVPVIPVRIGMVWGSIFSYYYGKLKFRIPKEIPYPASVTFGDPIPEGTTPFELRQIISELGADFEMTPRSTERTLHYQLAKNAKRRPFRTLLVDYGGKSLTSFQVYVGAAVLSRKFRELVAPECRYVGIMMPNCSVAAVSCVGILMADKVPAVLNFTSGRDAIRHAINKAGMTHVITSRKFLEKIKFEPMPEMVFLEDIAKTVTKFDKIKMFLLALLLPHQEFMSLISPETHRDVMHTAFVLFSSGSTGIPKGVMLSHHNFNSDINSFIKVMSWTDKDVILGTLPIFHAFGLNTALWMPLMINSKVVYVTSPLDCNAVSKACLNSGVTILLGTPTFIQSYLRRCDPQIFAKIRLTVAGAERLRMDITERFDQAAKGERALIEGYGCTELSPIVAINIGNSVLDLGKTVGKRGSIGPAMPGICARIVDPVTRKPLPPDTEGLLVIKGPTVMQGYLGEPELTRQVIQNGWYNTGDIGKMDSDGYITLCGRLSRFSKIGGEMVPHELVECAINELLHQEEKTAAVSSIPDPVKGEALVVFYTNLPIPPEKIVEQMRESNITNLWIPKATNFYHVDALPMLGSGKLDLVALKQMADKLAQERKL